MTKNHPERAEPPNNVIAHEIGHLFAWPDEYGTNGGSIHKDYVVNGREDWNMGEARKGQLCWQMDSRTNLMGDGCNLPTARTPEYYFYHIRDWFASKTGLSWKVTA